MKPQTPDNEVALSESVWDAYWPDWESRAKAMKIACEKLEEENAALKKGKVFVDPKWIYDLETQLAKAHEELCQAGLREYGN